MTAGEEALSLFGELDGLFAPEMIATTPAELVQLVPGDHVAAMRAELEGSSGGCADYLPTIAGRWGDRPADDPDNPCCNCRQPRRAHAERASSPGGAVFEYGGQLGGPDEAGRLELAAELEAWRHENQDETLARAAELAAQRRLELEELAAPAELLPHDAGRPACVHCGEAVMLENPEWIEDGDLTSSGPLHDRCSEAFYRGELEDQGDELEAELEPGPLVVIPCSGAKLGRTAPAGELYVGTLYRLALKAARAMTTDDRIRIFSARHGLVSLEAELEPYEQKITTPAGRVDWHTVRDHIRALPAGELVLLLPNDYASYFVDPVRAGHVWRPFRSALAGCAGIGEMRGRLSRIVQAGELEACELVGGIDTSSAAVILERLEAKTAATPAAELVPDPWAEGRPASTTAPRRVELVGPACAGCSWSASGAAKCPGAGGWACSLPEAAEPGQLF